MARSNVLVLRNRRPPLSIAEHPRHALRFRGRSFLALVLAPEAPLADWMAELDSWNAKSPGFFLARPVILDLSAITIEKDALASLVADLFERDIRIMGVEGVDASKLGLGLPPALTGGRPAGVVATIDAGRKPAAAVPHKEARELAEAKDLDNAKNPAGPAEPAADAAPRAIASGEPTSLLLDAPVRSGQSILFPNGDVTVVGSVASGAEIVAGGSIHIYGALRGRAIAGATGNANARIFCGKFEAELLAIDGLYKTADSIETTLRGQPVQAWIERDAIRIAPVANNNH
jgi:septum site-determining protein MinC